MAAKESCDVCAEKFNRSTRIPIRCISCESSSSSAAAAQQPESNFFLACRQCCKTYLLNNSQEPHCMSCRSAWPLRFMVDNFDRAFIDGALRTHREEVLFDRELSRMAATQPYVERLIQADRIQKEISDLEWARRDLEIRIAARMGEQRQLLDMNSLRKETIRKQFTQKCRNGDCTGFLSTQWKCGLCGTETCAHCHEIKKINNAAADDDADADTDDENRMATVEEHVCNPDTVASVQLMKRDTRSCPSCHVNIFRIEGCRQMWCTNCNTAFDWNTGLEEKGVIHNPHYFEWRRRQQGDAGGGGARIGGGDQENQLTHWTGAVLMRLMTAVSNGKNEFCGMFRQLNPKLCSPTRRSGSYFCDDICRNVLHIINVECGRFRMNATEGADRLGICGGATDPNLDLRAQYMRKQINAAVLKSKLQIREKHRRKQHEILNVLTMYANSANDILLRMLAFLQVHQRLGYITVAANTNAAAAIPAPSTLPPEEDMVFEKEFMALVEYTNSCFRDISRMFKSVAYYINQSDGSFQRVSTSTSSPSSNK